jgi:uncharacterized membrane protein YhiD involved in acid resistance
MDLFEIDPSTFEIGINILLAALLSFLAGQVYIRCGTSLSNRKAFAGNLYIIAMVTTLVISIVKSSLALSLGLVGALSIVRFRTAIKEPEELAFLFISIAIGLGMGAGQPVTTAFAVGIISTLIAGRFFMQKRSTKAYDHSYNLTISFARTENSTITLDSLTALIATHCHRHALKRFQNSGEIFDASYRVEFHDADQLSRLTASIATVDGSATVSFLDADNVGF